MSLTNRPEAVDITFGERLIGTVEGTEGGSTIVALAGLHGNEMAGVVAVEKVLKELEGKAGAFRGRLVGIRANIEALRRGVRYVDEDMNRIWFPSIIKKVRTTREENLRSNERSELKNILNIIDEIRSESPQPVILADMHTFSAEGSMFLITNRGNPNLDLLSKLHVPMVFGIDETLRGTALAYYRDRGMISFGLEAGQHYNKLTGYNSRASLMLLLEAAGCIDSEDLPELEEYRDHLRSHTRKLPQQCELVYQHIIEPGDEFKMRPGYKNFQAVKKGEWLATDQNGQIQARCDGFILMPLYQSQGNDGFFIIQENEAERTGA